MSWSHFIGSLRRSTSRPIRRRIHRSFTPGLGVEELESKRLLAADLVGVTPADDGSGGAGDNLVMTFSEEVRPGPGLGNIVIRHAADHSIIEVINVHSDRVSFAGNTVTVDPTVNLPTDSAVYVTVDQGLVRDTSSDVTTQTLLSEDFEGLNLKNSLLVPPFDDYVVTMTGTLNVTVAGEYTFGVNSDDGQELAIDLAQDGLDLVDDEIIFDDNTHGRQDRLSTCAFEDVDTVQSCEGQGDDAIALDVGQYDFIYVYFERGGGSGGEFFYAPGKHEAWDESAFVLVGDDSQGIGLVDGVTATTYKSPEGSSVGDLAAAESLIEDDSLIIGTEKLDLADVAENAGGRFNVNNAIPGAAQWAIDNDPNPNDWTDEGPFGWSRDNSFLEENRPGGQPEYNGWTFLDKEFWIAEQGDQARTAFENGEGTVAVVDPDAFDDFVGINSDTGDNPDNCPAVLEERTAGGECGYFNAGLSTPRIYLDGVSENTATLKFDSSWRDETTQSAEASVEFFDASGNSLGVEVLLRWESIDDGSENFKPRIDGDGNDAVNEEVVLGLDNPAEAASMIITFSMPYAQNDWWWAIDNVVVEADVAGSLFAGIQDDTTWNFTTTEGVSVNPQTLGDLDLDGQVAFADFLILSSNFGTSPATVEQGDMNENGTVDFPDFLILSSNFGKSVDEILGAELADTQTI